MDGVFAAVPLFILVSGAYLTFVAGLSENPPRRGRLAGVFAAIVFAASLAVQFYVALWIWDGDGSTLSYTLSWGFSDFAVYFEANALGLLVSIVATSLGLLVSVYSVGYMSHDSRIEFYYPLLVLMVSGIVGITISRDVFNLYLFFELMAIASYALVAFRKDEPEPVEAGIKYLVMSATGTALALLGIALLFRTTGTLDLSEMAAVVSGGGISTRSVGAGAALVIVGFGVKAAMVPLHTWLPDAHAAAPSGISAMLSGIVIQAGLFTMLRVLLALSGADLPIGLALCIFAILTMTLGNALAMVQKDIKRMLAYSSIAQMGYILLGIGMGLFIFERTGEVGRLGLEGGLFHIVTHAFMKGLAFLCAGAFIHAVGTRNIRDMRGLGHKMPLAAIAFTVALLALAGAPPFSGFMSEWMIFSAGIEAMDSLGWWGMLFAAAALVNALVSLAYYLPAIMTLFLGGGSESVGKAKDVGIAMALPMVAMVLITIGLGVWPSAGLRLVEPAVDYIAMLLGGGF